MGNYIRTLEGFVGPGNIKPGHLLTLFQSNSLTPQLEIFPNKLTQLSKILRFCHQNDLAVIPIGGGTQFDLGNPPIRADVIVNMTKLDQIIDYEPNDLTITVQAGITLAKLQKILSVNRHFVPIDPPNPNRATLGGTLATNASGLFSWQRTYPRDYVIGMKVVEANGLITKSGGKVVKNVTGYDMTKIHIGGLGTLGIISEISLKLIPGIKEKTITIDFSKFEDSFDAGLAIFNSHVSPNSLIVISPTFGKIMHPDSSDKYRLAIRLGGIRDSISRQVAEVTEIAHQYRGIRFNTPTIKETWDPIRDINFRKNPPIFMSLAINLLQSNIKQFISGLIDSERRLLNDVGYILDIQNGKINCYWYGQYEKDTKIQILETLNNLRTKAESLNGFLIITRAPDQIKNQIDVWGDNRISLGTMRRLKSEFDPTNILNPGRYIGGI